MLLKGKLLLSTQELNLLLGRDMSFFPPLRDIYVGQPITWTGNHT